MNSEKWHDSLSASASSGLTLLSCSPPRPLSRKDTDTRTSYSNFKEMLSFPRLPSGWRKGEKRVSGRMCLSVSSKLFIGIPRVTSARVTSARDTGTGSCAGLCVTGNISTWREVVEFRWDTQNTQTLPYWEYWDFFGHELGFSSFRNGFTSSQVRWVRLGWAELGCHVRCHACLQLLYRDDVSIHTTRILLTNWGSSESVPGHPSTFPRSPLHRGPYSFSAS